MNTNKGRWLMVLVIFLLIANSITLVIFWMDHNRKGPGPKGELKDFLVKELNMDGDQQAKFELLRNDHRQGVDSLREDVKLAKDHLFELVKDPSATDSVKQAAAAEVSKITEKIDLLTLDHFQKLRALCRPDQQTHFDELLHQMTNMLGAPRPPGPRGGKPERSDGPLPGN